MKDFIEIDGSQGEGGGQVLRTSLTLSAVTGQPVRIGKIRAGREKPGLKRQHLTCIKAVAAICGAKTSDVEVGSGELEFVPGAINGGDYRFDIGTAGSVTLVAQTVVPVLLKAGVPSTVTITGGTHVPFSPVWEFFVEIYLPELRRMGVQVEAEIDQCGFYPAAGGMVKLRVWPHDEAKRPDGYELVDLGEYKGGVVKGVVSHLPRSIAEAEVGIVGEQLRDLALRHEICEVDAMGPGNYCCAKLNYERGTVVFSGVGTYDKSRRAVANEIVQQVREFVKSGKACEKHLADQLLVPAVVFLGERYWLYPNSKCLGDGFRDWNVAVQKETLHFTTNQAVINRFMN